MHAKDQDNQQCMVMSYESMKNNGLRRYEIQELFV